MSAFYDQASLVVVPSGYKSGKIYAQKPLTTDGQLTFTRASTATRVNASGLIETVASGVPRLDYLNSTCPKLLLEPQRTNLVTYSDQFDNAAWSKTNVTVTANTAASPDGTTNADKLVDTATLSGHFVQQTISITGVHTFSVFAKAAERSVITLQVQEALTPANFALIYYNVSTGQVEAGEFSTSLSAGKIEAMGNGWYKCIITYTPQTAGNHNVRVFVAKNVSGNKVDYVGNGTDGVLIYGAQLEAGAYGTSYIPTTSAAVTRLADMSGSTNYFGAQTFAGNFTFFVDLLPMEGNTGTSDAMILGGGDYTDGVNFRSYFRFAFGKIDLRGVGELVLISRDYTMTANQQYKILVTRTGTTVKIFANGAQVGASATSSTSVILRSLGWSYYQTDYNYDGRINQVLLMPSGLTDAQAIELTTL